MPRTSSHSSLLVLMKAFVSLTCQFCSCDLGVCVAVWKKEHVHTLNMFIISQHLLYPFQAAVLSELKWILSMFSQFGTKQFVNIGSAIEHV